MVSGDVPNAPPISTVISSRHQNAAASYNYWNDIWGNIGNFALNYDLAQARLAGSDWMDLGLNGSTVIGVAGTSVNGNHYLDVAAWNDYTHTLYFFVWSKNPGQAPSAVTMSWVDEYGAAQTITSESTFYNTNSPNQGPTGGERYSVFIFDFVKHGFSTGLPSVVSLEGNVFSQGNNLAYKDMSFIRLFLKNVNEVYDGNPHGYFIPRAGNETHEDHTVTVEWSSDGTNWFPMSDFWKNPTYTDIVDSSTTLLHVRGSKPDFSYAYGAISITIFPREIWVKPVDETKPYDTLPLTPKTFELASESPYGLLTNHGHDLDDSGVAYTGSQTSVGSSPSHVTGLKISGLDISKQDNYNIIYKPGTLTVTPSFKITFKIEHGLWADGSNNDIIYYVANDGTTLMTQIPTGMTAEPGFNPDSGKWDHNPSDTTYVLEDLVFTYTFDDVFEVRYEYTGTVPDGAPSAPIEALYKSGTPVTVAATPTMAHYTFNGWSIQSPTTVDISSGIFPMPADNVVIIGSWSAIDYTVVYDPGDHGTWTATEETYVGCHYGDILDDCAQFVHSVDDCDKGWEFIGWSVGGGQVSKILPYTVSGDVIYVAQWTRLSYSVSFVY
ncbi:MAG: InlB B-repeat-containing protein, partial [Candidatus Bathyarchaeota archaeon]|nr:InlB B-repeat-containing protein [Candidatus Termiticorpusculum sp.]